MHDPKYQLVSDHFRIEMKLENLHLDKYWVRKKNNLIYINRQPPQKKFVSH